MTEYKFKSPFKLGDLIYDNRQKKLVPIRLIVFGVALFNGEPKQYINYGVNESCHRVHLKKDESLFNKEQNKYVIKSRYKIGQEVFVLKQDAYDADQYTIEKAILDSIAWYNQGEEEYQDIQYQAVIPNMNSLRYERNEGKNSDIMSIYDTLEDAKKALKRKNDRAKKITFENRNLF